MPPPVLIVASTRAHADTREILRIQDTSSALLAEGRMVDLLAPRTSPLLKSVLNPSVRVFTVPRIVPFTDNPPRRPSLRRFLTGVLMFLRGVALAARRGYGMLHGVNDGAMVACAISRFATAGRTPFIAEMHRPFFKSGMFRSPRTAIARFEELRALRRAAAIIVPDDRTFKRFGHHIPRSRVAIIPDPHVELVPDAFTYGEFADALKLAYEYVHLTKEHDT